MNKRMAMAVERKTAGLRIRTSPEKLNPASSKDPVLVGKAAKGPLSEYTVVIFGLPRGGTTMVAGVAQKLGLWIGENLGSNLEDPAFDRKPIEEMRAAVEARNAQRSVWGWKYPGAARYLPKLLRSIRNPRFVVVWRDPLSASLRKLDQVRRRTAADEDFNLTVLEVLGSRIAHQQLNVEVLRQFNAPTLHVSYEKALRHPEAFVRSLAQFTGLEVPEDLSGILSFMEPESYKHVPPSGDSPKRPATAATQDVVREEPQAQPAPETATFIEPVAATEAGAGQIRQALLQALGRPVNPATSGLKARRKPPARLQKSEAEPINMAPRPLVNADAGLTVIWSPKSACTTTYVWFAHLSGFSKDVREYAAWPHKHRQEVYNVSPLRERSIAADHMTNKVLRVIRDPYSRTVSIYRHALQTCFADSEIAKFGDGSHSLDKGMSFQTFLDLLATLDMRKVDIHFRPQFHPYEAVRKPDTVINISKQDLFTELNRFEEQNGYARTDFSELDWLKNLEQKRKARQEEMAGDALDTMPFTRHQVSKLHQFPRYDQLLTPEARQKIEAIYKVDFDAYSAFL